VGPGHRAALQGGDYCFAVRAVDNAGNTSPWTTPRCTARPLDDRALSVGAGWARGTGSSYREAAQCAGLQAGGEAPPPGVSR
jgi:hypothetical protein